MEEVLVEWRVELAEEGGILKEGSNEAGQSARESRLSSKV